VQGLLSPRSDGMWGSQFAIRVLPVRPKSWT